MMALLRKELREHLLSRKGLFIFFIISLLFSVLAFSFISVKELSLLAQVEVNMTFIKMMLGISNLVLMILGATMISGEREKGTLESLLLTPLSKMKIMLSKLAAIFIFWLVLVLLSLPYFIALTVGTNLFPILLAYIIWNGTLLVISFAGLSLAISAWVASTKNALLLSIIIFFIAVIPMFLSTTTKKVGFAHFVDQSSPVSSSMLAMKDLMVNKLGVMTLLIDSLPVCVFFVIMVLIFILASKKVNFLGGE
jgi:ABC-2 type transport system permease protein